MAPVVDMAMGDQLRQQQLVHRTACSSDIWSGTTNSRFNWSRLDWDHLLQRGGGIIGPGPFKVTITRPPWTGYC